MRSAGGTPASSPEGVPASAAADRAGRRDASGTTYTNKSGRDWLLLSCISPVITGDSLPTTHALANQRVAGKAMRTVLIFVDRNRRQIKDLNRNLICEDKGLR